MTSTPPPPGADRREDDIATPETMLAELREIPLGDARAAAAALEESYSTDTATVSAFVDSAVADQALNRRPPTPAGIEPGAHGRHGHALLRISQPFSRLRIPTQTVDKWLDPKRSPN